MISVRFKKSCSCWVWDWFPYFSPNCVSCCLLMCYEYYQSLSWYAKKFFILYYGYSGEITFQTHADPWFKSWLCQYHTCISSAWGSISTKPRENFIKTKIIRLMRVEEKNPSGDTLNLIKDLYFLKKIGHESYWMIDTVCTGISILKNKSHF